MLTFSLYDHGTTERVSAGEQTADFVPGVRLWGEDCARFTLRWRIWSSEVCIALAVCGTFLSQHGGTTGELCQLKMAILSSLYPFSPVVKVGDIATHLFGTEFYQVCSAMCFFKYVHTCVYVLLAYMSLYP